MSDDILHDGKGTPLPYATKDKTLDGIPVTGVVLMIPVESTAITHYGYAQEQQMLFLHFRHRHNTMHVLFDVPVGIWEGFLTAESKGKYYNTYLKDKYDCTPALITQV